MSDDDPTEPPPSLRRKLVEEAMGYRALADRLGGIAGRLPVMEAAERQKTMTELAIELRRIGDASHELARDVELPRRRTTLALRNRPPDEDGK